MSRWPMLVLLALGTIGGGDRDLYCPECERFSSEEWAIDAQGLCRGCERRPVEVESTLKTWIWCETDDAWRAEACSHDRALRCCSTWTAAALTSLPMEVRVSRLPFCPRCRSFRAIEPGRDGRDRCAGCGKTAATTFAADLTWVWCRTEKRWATGLRHPACCSARDVRVPVELSLLPLF